MGEWAFLAISGSRIITDTANSFSTVRPVKKVDAVGSQRLSNDFVGAGSVRKAPMVPQLSSPIKSRPALSERGRAGQALVEEVVLGVLDSVSLDIVLSTFSANEIGRPLQKIMTLQRLRQSI